MTLDPNILRPTLDEARAVLTDRWGYQDFHPEQEDALKAILAGKDALVILPTSRGKSVLFQIPALLLEGTTIVVTPLIALMEDQVRSCEERGIAATFLSSTVHDDVVGERMEELAKGRYQLLYVAPERFVSRRFLDVLNHIRVPMIAVDECHCTSRLGKDFRPAYLRIHDLVAHCSDSSHRPQVLACSATVTPDMEPEIIQACALADDYHRVLGSPLRDNIEYRVWGGNPFTELRKIVTAHFRKEGRHVVYCSTRNGCKMVAGIIREVLGLDEKDKTVTFYHAGLDRDERSQVQAEFTAAQSPIIVATCAFGMGINVPDIRTVTHFGVPASLEDYVQESGRAGRDGQLSYAYLLCQRTGDPSVRLKQFFIDVQNPPYEIYEKVWDYLNRVLEPGQALALSAEGIAKDMQEKGYKLLVGAAAADDVFEGLGGMIGGCLSTMEAYGLIHRTYQKAAAVLEMDKSSAKDLLGATFTEGGRNPGAKVMRHVQRMVQQHSDSDEAWKTPVVRLDWDETEVSKTIGLNEAGVQRVIRTVGPKFGIERIKAYRGKITRLREEHIGAEINTILPRQRIDEKRQAAQRRLRLMVDYLNAPQTMSGLAKGGGDAAYRAYILRYFEGLL